jgi:hypothetical protein
MKSPTTFRKHSSAGTDWAAWFLGITNARAERLALAAIEKVVGRPSLTAKFVESPQVQFRIPMKLKKALDKEAKRRGETKSVIVREALEKYLKSA